MEFVETTMEDGSKTLVVKMNRVERSTIAAWHEASRVYPGVAKFDSDFIRSEWFKKHFGKSNFQWIDYGYLGTLGGIPILGIPGDRGRHYILSNLHKGNVMKDLLLYGWCSFVDISTAEARVLERKEIVTGGLPFPGLDCGEVQADGASG